ncbi:hypothetical protein ATCC53582_01479 [Novacetimonas hansenii]|nr:hypothetical protein ATCC53582_01479 [Novacetimonas hansenii]
MPPTAVTTPIFGSDTTYGTGHGIAAASAAPDADGMHFRYGKWSGICSYNK